jgi:hypothetical protein
VENIKLKEETNYALSGIIIIKLFFCPIFCQPKACADYYHPNKMEMSSSITLSVHFFLRKILFHSNLNINKNTND